LTAKVVAELPLDTLFTTVFTTVLKLCSGVRISWRLLTATFSLLTVSGASLGFMLGSWFQGSRELSMASSSPVVVVLMVVGVINPGGVDAKSPPPPALVRWLKRCSPFVYAVEALCLGEYPGMQLRGPRDGLWGRLKDLPKMGAFAMVQNGDQVIEALGLKGKTYQCVMSTLGKLSIYYLALSWVGLQVMGHHSQWSATGSAESCHSKGNGTACNSKTPNPTNEDMLMLRNKGSRSEMSALKVPPRGW
jgi:ABC-2 type transporter